MQESRRIEYIQDIGIAALVIFWKESFDLVNSRSIESTVLAEVVSAMETHSRDPHLYTVACSAIGTLL